MRRLFATCARGLEPVLARELDALGALDVRQARGGVAFRGPADLVYRCNLWLRTAVRVLAPVLEATTRTSDELYEAVRTVDWSEHLTPERTLAVDCNVRDSGITHSQFASRRVKDAICDQFRDRLGVRPSVNVDRPHVGLNLHIGRDQAVLSLDSSWDSLHKRGYSPVKSRAPLNEALAAGLLLSLGYDGSRPLYDPLCGSGTFAIEAALIALNRAPGLHRQWFAFEGWADFDPVLWGSVRAEARDRARAALPAPIAGSDIRPDAIQFARDNAHAAGVGPLLDFRVLDVRMARPPESCRGRPGQLIANPPYGERLGDEEELDELYTTVGRVVKQHWPGWELALFTANAAMAQRVKLPVRAKPMFFNGSLECRLYQYKVPATV